MKRTTLAFLVAPLWVPLVVTPTAAIYLFHPPAQFFWVIITGFYSAIFAYLGSFAIGFPLFKFLLARGIVSAWVAIIAGMGVAVVTWLVFLLCFGVLLDGVSVGVDTLLHTPISGWELAVPASFGIVVGLTIWGIARPDKEPSLIGGKNSSNRPEP